MKIRVTRSIVPNMLTLGNLFSGFSAIVFLSQGNFAKAAMFILLAAIFDMLDGVMARLVRATSELGAELDSLCDAVSFGVAPSFMLYQAFFRGFGEFGILMASLPALAGVVRLARFNVQLTSFEDKLYFKGMPIPSGALIIVSYVLFLHLGNSIPREYMGAGMYGVTILTSLAMVSTIKYDNLPRPTLKSFRQRPAVFIVFFAGIILCLLFGGKCIFWFMMFYLITGAIRQLVNWIKLKREPEDEIDDMDDDED